MFSKLFEENVVNNPNKAAIVFEDKCITYEDLNIRSNQLARHIRNRYEKLGHKKFRPNLLIGLLMNSGSEIIIAILSILKAGGAYVPIDPNYPIKRINYILQDSKVDIVIATRETVKTLQKSLASEIIITIDEPREEAEIEQLHMSNINIINRPYDLAYVIYTSGSTGNPKGVMVEHKALLLFLQGYIKQFCIKSVNFLSCTSFTFDISILEHFLPLITSGTIYLSTIEDMRDALIKYYKVIDVIQQTPSVWRQVLHDLDNKYTAEMIALTGGERLDQDVHQILHRYFKRVYNMYGPTETVIWSTTFEIKPDQSPSIVGKPLPNEKVYILDENLNQVSVGVTGELYIGGGELARGYLNQQQLTAESFIPNPFVTEFDKKKGYTRLYKTGDLAKWLLDGNIEFIGRIDHQIKLLGHRIELGEIESVVGRHKFVRQNVVIVVGGGDAKKMVCYFVSGDEPVSSEELKNYAGLYLPDYMVPATFIELEGIPLTLSGKIDRSKLPIYDPKNTIKYVKPKTEQEKTLVEIWQDILSIRQVGIRDNFWDLGGNSLKAIRITNALRKKYNAVIYTKSIYEAPTIAEYGLYLEKNYSEIFAKKTDESQYNNHPSRVTPLLLSKFSKLISKQDFDIVKSTRKNPKIVVILSPPRSGSTLLRIMLGGNPELFSPPELGILSYKYIEEAELLKNESFVRAIMQILQCDVDLARKHIEHFYIKDMSIKDLYLSIQDKIFPKILVEKSTSYALSISCLNRIEGLFSEALYVHLVRDPAAMINSYVNAKLDLYYKFDITSSPVDHGELVWLLSHKNIFNFLETVPRERQFQIRYEDLISNPATYMQSLSKFIGIKFCSEMTNPYRYDNRLMTNGLYSDFLPVDDPKFHTYSKIETNTASSWERTFNKDYLSGPTKKWMKKFGYDIPDQEVEEFWRI